jgi:hypothetical protein
MTTVQHEEYVLTHHLGIVHDTNLKVGTKRRWTNLKSKPKKGEKMIVTDDGYSLSYSHKDNRIVIGLPITWETHPFTTLVEPSYPIRNHKEELSEGEQMIILAVVKQIVKTHEKEDEVEK